MKKVLALILTATMLLGCVIFSSSAAQVVTSQENTNHYWSFVGGSAYNPLNLGYDDGLTPKRGFVLEFDLMFTESTQNTHGILSYGSQNVPFIDFNAKTIGVDDVTTSYAAGWVEGQWYNFKFDTLDSSSTTIYVDDTLVGTVGKEVKSSNSFIGNWRDVAIDNLKTLDDEGTVLFSEDFENGAIDGQGVLAEDTTTTYVNENVVGYNNKYWVNDADNAYFYIEAIPGASAPSKLSFDFRLDADNSETRSYFGSDPIVKKDGTVGLGSEVVSYAGGFATGTWYNIEYLTVEGGTQVSIDGSVVGTVNKAIPAAICGGAILIAYDNFVVEEGGAVVYSEDFEDGDFDSYDGNGAIATNFVATARYDLGLKYWVNDSDNAYFYIEAIPGASAPSKLSFDFRLDADNSETRSYFGSDPIVKKDGTVGLGGEVVSYAGGFATGTWYHIEYVTAAGGTEVLVDGVSVGTVNKAIPAAICGGAILIAFDNYTVEEGGSVIYSEDFEDGDFDSYDGNGYVADHDLGVVVADPIVNIDTTCAPEGEASLIELSALTENAQSTGFAFFYNSGKSEYADSNLIFNFDLALVANDLTSSSPGSWLEIWFSPQGSTGQHNRRYKVGTEFVGKDNDTSLFAWGDATATNFHDITIWNDTANRFGKIYIDGVMVYEGTAGSLSSNLLLFGLYKSSAIIDNFKIYNAADYSVVQDGLPEMSSNGGGFAGVKTIAVGGDCAANGHIYGHQTRTTAPTCYSLGVDTYYCAVCGEAYHTVDVPMIDHNWEKYNINRIDDDGLCYNYCTRCADAGLVERKYTAIPAAEDYTGTLLAFFDFSDDLTTSLDTFTSESFTFNGELQVVDASNYHLLNDLLSHIYNDGSNTVIDPDDYSLTWDFCYDQNSTVDPGSYGHTVYWFMADGLNKQAFVGYDADNEQFYCKPAASGLFSAFTADYTLVPGEFYNIKTSFVTDDDMGTMEITVYVNGEAVLTTPDTEDLYFGCAYDADLSDVEIMGLRIFGVDFTAKNFAIGDSAWTWANRTYGGDVDGDYALTSADALLMRKYLAKVIGDADLVSSRLDANGDDAVNAKDQLTIRKALVA